MSSTPVDKVNGNDCVDFIHLIVLFLRQCRCDTASVFERAAVASAAARNASTVNGKAGYVYSSAFHPIPGTKYVCKCGYNQTDPQKHKQHLDILICGSISTLPHLTMPMRLYKFTYEFGIQHPGVLTIESQLTGLLVTLATIAHVDLTIQRRRRGLLHPADS